MITGKILKKDLLLLLDMIYIYIYIYEQKWHPHCVSYKAKCSVMYIIRHIDSSN